MCKVFEEFGADIYSLVGYASPIIVFNNGITTQVICFPAEARIYLADAAAIKVCSVATEYLDTVLNNLFYRKSPLTERVSRNLSRNTNLLRTLEPTFPQQKEKNRRG